MLAQLNARTTTKLCGGRLSACAEARTPGRKLAQKGKHADRASCRAGRAAVLGESPGIMNRIPRYNIINTE